MRRVVIVFLMIALLFPRAVAAVVELKPSALEAFARYARLTEERMAGELGPGGTFLSIDGLAAPQRQAALAELQAGRVFSFQPQTRDRGRAIKVPGGTINHWIGTIFIPGVTLAQVTAIMQDYDRHQEYLKPNVMRSRILTREGHDFTIYLRYKLVKVWTAVLNTEHHVHYVPVSPTRLYAKASSTRVAEVLDADSPKEREYPLGRDNGYVWRINSYWRVEEREGGSYLQVESITMGRDIPFLFRWVVEPILLGFSRDLLVSTLVLTRDASVRRP